MRALLDVGRDLLRDSDGQLRENADKPTFLELVQRRVHEAVDARLGMSNLGNVCETFKEAARRCDPALAAKATLRSMTREEKRLVLSVYLAARIHRDDDPQLFLTNNRRRRRANAHNSNLPMGSRPPLSAAVVRVMAIYHHLARQPHVLGPQLLDRFASLRECGLIKLEQAHKEHDARVLCAVELPLARIIAGELDVDLAEYLCD
jgi:hypothetical protein